MYVCMYDTGVCEAECPESQIRGGVRDTAETVLNRVNRLMYDDILHAELQYIHDHHHHRPTNTQLKHRPSTETTTRVSV